MQLDFHLGRYRLCTLMFLLLVFCIDARGQNVVVKESGPSHDKTFEVEVRLENITLGKGVGKSKKEAEQLAAKDALSKRVK